MQPIGNPFTPIFGKTPAYMAGREGITREIEAALDSNGNDPSLVSLLVGPRGMGKTAMLSMCADMAEERGWVAARVTAAPDMLDEIPLRLGRSASHLLNARSGKKLAGIGIAALGSIEWDNTPAEAASWRTRMDGILDELERSGTGLLVTVDEVDPDIAELTTLVTAFQHFLDEGRKASLIMAGLPYSVSALLSGKRTSFLRRAARYKLGPIGDYDVQEALVKTMEAGGKSIGGDALRHAVRAIGGFPYLLQLLGYRAWNLAGDRSQVTVDDVRSAADIAQLELNERVYEATLMELTAADRDFLAAMLEDREVSRQADIARRLGKQSGHVSKYKKRLLLQGIIQERAKGQLEFCLPGFREYLQDQRA